MLQKIEPVIIGFMTVSMMLLVATVVGSRRRVGQLKRKSAEIHQEERRVFDFLHGLGAAFSEGVPAGELHRLIVEGACHILKAGGGALYLVDREGENLLPTFLSKGCPPFEVLPEALAEEASAEVVPQSVESFVRLHAVPLGEGLIGGAVEW